MKAMPAVAAAVLAGVLLTATPAEAHTALTKAVPGSGATVPSPARIQLTFADPVRFPGVVVLDAKGGRHESGRPKVVRNVVTQEIAGTLPPGVYRVGWRVVAPDGHPATGDYRFTVAGQAAGDPARSATPRAQPVTPPANPPASRAPQAQPAPKASSAGWWWIGLGALLVGAGAGGLALARRRR